MNDQYSKTRYGPSVPSKLTKKPSRRSSSKSSRSSSSDSIKILSPKKDQSSAKRKSTAARHLQFVRHPTTTKGTHFPETFVRIFKTMEN